MRTALWIPQVQCGPQAAFAPIPNGMQVPTKSPIGSRKISLATRDSRSDEGGMV